MTITVPQLEQHILIMNKGHIDLSKVEWNCRADLVRFLGVSLEKAVEMSEDEVYGTLDADGNSSDEPFENQYGLTCKCCSKPVRMDYTDNPSDGYNLICSDNHYGFISVYATDAMDEGMEYERQVGEEVKNMLKSHYVQQTKVSKDDIRTNGCVIQILTTISNKYEYYELQGIYYSIEDNDLAYEYYKRT
jgi:hypothetical protein